MKQLVVVLMLAFSVSALFGQVPEKVTIKFKEKHPAITDARWVALGDNQYAVMYKDNSVDNFVVYDMNGDIISNDMVTVEYPTEIKTYYVKNYPDSKDYHVWVATDTKGNKTYYVRDHGYRIWFDKAGHFIRKEADKVKEEYKEEKNDLKDHDDDDDD